MSLILAALAIVGGSLTSITLGSLAYARSLTRQDDLDREHERSLEQKEENDARSRANRLKALAEEQIEIKQKHDMQVKYEAEFQHYVDSYAHVVTSESLLSVCPLCHTKQIFESKEGLMLIGGVFKRNAFEQGLQAAFKNAVARGTRGPTSPITIEVKGKPQVMQICTTCETIWRLEKDKKEK